jgi:hypothetical protein
MAFQLYARHYNPGFSFYLKNEQYATYDEAVEAAKYHNRRSDLCEYSVISDQLVETAYQETMCFFGEHGIPNPDEDEFDERWMQYIEKFRTLESK